MGRITVSTGTKTKEADAITNPLLSDLMLIEAGRALLYKEMIDRNQVAIELAMVESLPVPSDIVLINETALGIDYHAVVTGFSLSIGTVGVDISIDIERPIYE